MGKPIQQGKKPPYFRECPICHKEFGSRSLEIHMSRCLERQKSSSDQVKLISYFEKKMWCLFKIRVAGFKFQINYVHISYTHSDKIRNLNFSYPTLGVKN